MLMRKLALVAACCSALLLAHVTLAQQVERGGGFGGLAGRGAFGGTGAGGSSDNDTRDYDKHDFSGLWSRSPNQYNLGPCPECRDPASWPGYGFFGETPPMTPEGQARFESYRPARGIELGTEQAAQRTDIHIGYRRAVLPAFGNDPPRLRAESETLDMLRRNTNGRRGPRGPNAARALCKESQT